MTYLALCLIAAVILALPAASAAPSRDDVLRHAVESGEATWRRANELPDNLTSRELFTYALALCEADRHLDRLDRLFEVAERMQDRDPESRGYGNFHWRWAEGAVLDFNAVEFCMQAAAILWLRHRDSMPTNAGRRLREMLEYAVEGCLRHRVPSNYTNIALMNAENLILLGEALEKRKVADEGYRRLERVCLYTWEFGIHEYDSPTYYGTDLDCLVLIEAFCERERGREQARGLLELLWSDIALNWFAPSQRLAGARSRDYDYLRGLGYLDCQLWVAGWLKGVARGGTSAVYPALAEWRPPERLRQMSLARFPRLVRQSWGIPPCQSRTHYMLRDVTLSTAGANYGPMDLPLTVDLPGDRSSIRCYFIPDGRRDPYGKKVVPAGPHRKTLHLRPFFAAAQRNGDAVALVIYRDRDLPDDAPTLESHFVIPGDLDALWIGDRRVDVANLEPIAIPIEPDQPVVLRRARAAVGVRVPWARALDGGPAPTALVYDGNPDGALRITVAHHGLWGVESRGANAGAAFWVRVAGGVATEAAFRDWRKRFAAATVDIHASPDEVGVSAVGADGPVSISAAAPYSGCAATDPAPPRAVLELDGEDIGRGILRRIEPIKSYEAERGLAAPVMVSADRGTYWEAESGHIVPPMEVGEDEEASGGKYVWMPGDPGARGGDQLGSVTWRLIVPKAAGYYVWGRVVAPTPDDDSFFVTVGDSSLIALAEWHTGTHENWEWTPLALDNSREPTRLALPEGETSLRLRVREDGTKIDRLFITLDPNERPA
ncbi:MAG: hypothetical protein ACE5O2_03025 [Armatimonadota bacterium]